VEDARTEAWRTLCSRIRRPVLFQLRRRIEGWRLTEELADDVCERLRGDYEGKGLREDAARMRACCERELRELCEERGVSTEIDQEFERDWASSLFAAALQELSRRSPDTHRLVLRLFDRPKGGAPLSAEELARRLQLPLDEVEAGLARGRAELRRLFETEIAHTVVDKESAEAEVEQLMPQAEALFT